MNTQEIPKRKLPPRLKNNDIFISMSGELCIIYKHYVTVMSGQYWYRTIANPCESFFLFGTEAHHRAKILGNKEAHKAVYTLFGPTNHEKT